MVELIDSTLPLEQYWLKGASIMVTDLTQLTGDYGASWLPWIMIPMVFYILPFPIFALLFLWIEREVSEES
jgi:photosystem I subunit 8